jgi:hypothetical protein
LSDLTSVDLNDSAWDYLTPFVPKMSHAYLVADQADSLAVSVLWGSWLQLKVSVDIVFERSECIFVIFDSIHGRSSELCVVEDLGLLHILLS